VFDKTRAMQLGAEVLVSNLCALDEAPWAEWRRGEKPITARGVALLLKPFGVTSKHTRLAREYHQADFVDAWKRYLPSPTPSPSVTSVTELENKENSDSSNVTRDRCVTDGNGEDLNEISAVTDVTLETGFPGLEQKD
jgi:putative DNA primase/helicase